MSKMEQINHYIIQVENLRISQGNKILLRDVNMAISKHNIVALVGPSDHGKAIMLRAINQLFSQDANYKISGTILLENQPIRNIPMVQLRQDIGMVFSTPNLFSMSIYENLVFGLRLNKIYDKKIIQQKIRHVLTDIHLWDRFHNKLHQSINTLTVEEQQLFCLARTLILNPKVILMEKPTISLNSSAKSRFEDLIFELKQKYTIIMTVEDKQQAGRLSDKVAFFYKGQLVEYGQTKNIFTHPQEALTESYITGRITY